MSRLMSCLSTLRYKSIDVPVFDDSVQVSNFVNTGGMIVEIFIAMPSIAIMFNHIHAYVRREFQLDEKF